MMYVVIEKPDGTYRCEGRLQDGTERWDATTLQEAVKSMKEFAKSMNGTKIKKRHIQFLRAQQVVRSEYVEFHPFGPRKPSHD